ncbi:hypothetical protein JCM6882_007887 [Rhodosporidiobolus microsporus]
MHVLFLCYAASALLWPVVALWPAPRSMSNGTGVVRLAESFEIVVAESLPEGVPSDLRAAIERAAAQLEIDNFQLLIPGRGESDRAVVEKALVLTRLELSLSSSAGPLLSVAEETYKFYEDKDESYTLSIPSTPGDGVGAAPSNSSPLASLTANTTLGLVRGLQTFTQLVYTLPGVGFERYILGVPLLIDDEPAFPHRGFMLDTSRNFYPIDDILRTLDTMASVKLSTFHWHATDSQSWPLFIPTFPNLTDFGAYSPAETYDWEDVYRVQEYAAGLGISVMLEIDMPGHTASIFNSFPEHIACFETTPWAAYAAEPPAGQLRLGNEATLKFAQEIVKSAMSMTKAPYFSTGGDEVNEACYSQDSLVSTILTRRNTTVKALLDAFVSGLHGTVREAGKTPVVWEEMVLDFELPLRNDTIVLVWKTSDNVAAVAEKGYRIIHAASDYFYLDCGMGGWLGNNVGGNSWCDPFKNWQKTYSFDPFANLTADQQTLVLGGQALLWSEQASPENLDSLAWPRAAAAAEVFWTGGAVELGERDVAEALPRLHDWRYRAVARGVKAAPLQPHYCALRPQVCNRDA